MNGESPAPAPDDRGPEQLSAGAMLRAAREAHGASIETVAQHLKLAPRQVRALEQDAYAELPGRTFVRGFARNYARLVQIDVDAVMAALPDSMAPAIADDNPATISPGVRPIGELPASPDRERGGWSRWVIALVIIALIAVAFVYETRRREQAAELAAQVAAPSDPIGPSPAPDGATALPNPMVAADAPTAPASAAPAGAAPVSELPPATVPAASEAPPPASVAQPAAAAAETATLVIRYRAAAWTEVRDGRGERLLVGTMPAGSSQTVSGLPPFEVTLGNALQTSVTWRGAPFDLAPHIRQNIARVRLQ
jgi:cytoskeleton protein RodZ